MARIRRRGRPTSANRIGWSVWTFYVADAPPELPGAEECLAPARARWRVEQVFRLWKSEALVDESASAKPYGRPCEPYAKPIGVARGAAPDDAGGRVGARGPEPDQDG